MADLKEKKVVLVDDDKFLLEMYARKFKGVGAEIQSFTSAEAALEYISDNKVDVFIFDIIMPQMDGLELITKVRADNLISSAKKIALTNQGQQSDVDKAEEIGVDGYIVKALHTPSEVVKLVEEILNK